MMILWIAAILLGFVDCLAQVNWSYEIDDKNCDVFIQVNEDKNVLYLETMHIPGQYMTTSCWGTSATMCHINENDESYINGMKRNGSVTFLNNENQICFFENLGFRTGNMSGFFYQPWSYVYAVNIKVSCEDSSSIPMYCAKTEKMARQVLLAREELECAAKDGNFEGGVYPFEMPNGETEYCVAGRCDVCNSKWYDDFINHWKDSVCCEMRGKEPNTNNGTCVSPDSFDSTKVGVKHSRITAFPGCSQVTAGEENHFCKEPESSSSESSSTEWSSSSAESSSSDGSSSSSAMLISSSSEEQESADCYTGVAEANAALYNVEVECWSMQKESGYSLDGNGCLVGGCIDANSSDSTEDGENSGESSSSEAGSSSSEEDRCVDVSLKKVSGEEADPWVYIGKEMYASRTVSYEKTKPSSKMFDALGRMYRQIKSRIKYYMGKESKVQKTMEVGEELDVWKRNFVDFSGNVAVSYVKRDHDWNIFIDSSVYLDETYSIIEMNNKKDYVRLRMTSGIEYYSIIDEFDNLKRSYSVAVDGDTLEEILYRYEPETDYILGEKTNVLKKESYEVDSGSKLSTNNSTLLYSCTEFKNYYLKTAAKDDPAPLSAICENPTKPASDFYEKTKGLIYYPGLRVKTKNGYVNSATFGQLRMDNETEPPNTYYSCECLEKDVYVHSYRFDNPQAYVIIYASNWKYDVEQELWEKKCWKKEDMQKTYNHEMGHYKNILIQYPKILEMFFVTKDNYKQHDPITTMTECEKMMHEAYKYARRLYLYGFLPADKAHLGGIGNTFPPSPKPTSNNNREGQDIICSE